MSRASVWINFINNGLLPRTKMVSISINFIDSGFGFPYRRVDRKMEEDISKVDVPEGANRPPCSNDTKRHKEMENVALQSSLNREVQQEEQKPRQEEKEGKDGPELTQTDHLNKRLLTSFLEKINQPNFSFPNLLQLGNLPEDSNKMLEDW